MYWFMIYGDRLSTDGTVRNTLVQIIGARSGVITILSLTTYVSRSYYFIVYTSSLQGKIRPLRTDSNGLSDPMKVEESKKNERKLKERQASFAWPWSEFPDVVFGRVRIPEVLRNS
jgi:hypothetical protein